VKNFSDSIGNRIRDLPVCSAVPQPTAPPHYVQVGTPFIIHRSRAGCPPIVRNTDSLLFKNVSVVGTRPVFRRIFNTGVLEKILNHDKTKKQTQKLRIQASAPNNKPGDRVRTVWTHKTRTEYELYRLQPQTVRRHCLVCNILSRSLNRTLHSDLNYHPY
jgi:hypothetical protein